ncbi:MULTISPECIES: hypothetical protein [unclassified Pannonibacter]|uniref:hypothetical protein n=1 Tax=unclassified Pannonibacter TaxID=2627228 RepID=UPI0016476AD5|nr:MULTISPECIES: hypothetical protein [unclassified Pannonibacter]
MNAPLHKIQEFYGLPKDLLIQIIHLTEDGAYCMFSGDEFRESEAAYIRWAKETFGDLGELDEIGYDALGDFLRDQVDIEDGHETTSHYKVTSPDGVVYSDISPEAFDMLWDAIYLKRSLHVRGREGNRYRVGVSPNHAAVTLEWGASPSDLKVVAIAGKNGGKDEVYVRSANAVRKFLLPKSFELAKAAANVESKPGTVDFIKTDMDKPKKSLLSALTRKLQ